MLSWMTETESIWTRLEKTRKPILLYGMGDGAVKIKTVLDKIGVPISGVFASDSFVRGQTFLGHRVLRLDEAEEQFSDFFILLSFGVHDQPTIDRIFSLAERYELAAPDVPVAGEIIFDAAFLWAHAAEWETVYAMLADEQSRQVYADLLNFKLSGKPEYLSRCTTTTEEAYTGILKPGQDEVYVDLGAYRGETIAEFLHYTGGQCERVIAFEPDERNYRKLCRAVEQMNLKRADCYHLAAYSHPGKLLFDSRAGRQSALIPAQRKPLGTTAVHSREVAADSLDHLLAGDRVSFLNIDVEGGERQAILGCRQTITAHQPNMLIAAYHRSEDLFALPLQIAAIRTDYSFYFRHTRYLPGWDTNLYCVSWNKAIQNQRESPKMRE